MPDVNLGVVLAILAPLVGLMGYLVKPVADANRDLRSTVAALQRRNQEQEQRIRILEDLVTSSARVDELRRAVEQHSGDILREVSRLRREFMVENAP